MMRFSHLLFPLFLILNIQIQSSSAQNSIIGTWSNPSITVSESDYCCVPTSITIENSGLDKYTATYKYVDLFDKEGEYNKECFTVFLGSNSGKLKLFKNSDSDGYYSETTLFGSKVFNFNVTNSTSLNIYMMTSDDSGSCNFSMNSKESFSGSSSGGHTVFYGSLLIIILAALASYKSYQRKQQAILSKQNLDQAHKMNSCVYHNQQFGQGKSQIQTATSYAAPGQFSSTETSIDFTMNIVN